MSFNRGMRGILCILLTSCSVVFGQVYTPPSGGYSVNKAALGAGIGAGVGAGVLFMTLHNHGVYKGCVGQDGKTLTRKDGKSFELGSSLKPGEKFSIKAKKDKEDPTGSKLNVIDIKKDLGPCEK
jgi:hypothetical protein